MDVQRASKRKRMDVEEGQAEAEGEAELVTTSSSSSMNGEENGGGDDARTPAQLLDVLPYVDPYSEEDKQAALRLIQEEMATFQPRADYLDRVLPPPPIPSFLGGTAGLLEAEMERVGAGKPPVGGFDGSRYALRRPQGADDKNPEAWEEAIKQAELVLQHQHSRLANLRLLEQFGPNAWLTNNQRLQSMQQQLDEELRTVRTGIEDLNRKRLEEQQVAGAKIQRAQTEWSELVRKNMQLDVACLQLEHDIASLPKPPSDSL